MWNISKTMEMPVCFQYMEEIESVINISGCDQ
jgi:hypothetical protein